jgi:hypothetical protein
MKNPARNKFAIKINEDEEDEKILFSMQRMHNEVRKSFR